MKNKALTTIILIGIFIRILGVSFLDLGQWDERFHANVAKNFLNHPFEPYLIDDGLFDLESENWAQTDVWLAKPPIALWTITAGIFLFGPNELGLRFFSLIFSVICILLSYRIGKKLYNEKIGLMTGFFYAINGLMYRINTGNLAGDHVDTLFHLMALIIVYYIIKNNKNPENISGEVIGLLIGLAFLVKWTMIFLLVPFFVIILYGLISSKKVFLLLMMKSVLFFLIIVCPWVIWIYFKFPTETLELAHGLITPINIPIHGHKGPWYFYLNQIRIHINELIYFPIIFLIYYFVKRKTFNRSVLFYWIFVPLILLSISQTKREVYLLTFATPIFIVQSLFISYLWKFKERFYRPIFIKIIIGAIFGLALRYSIERLKLSQKRFNMPEYRVQFEDWYSKGHLSMDQNFIITNDPKYLELRYYYGVKAYNYLTDSILNDLKKREIKVYSYQDGKYILH